MPQGREVEGPHSHVLQRARWIRRRWTLSGAHIANPKEASGTAVCGGNFNKNEPKKFQEGEKEFLFLEFAGRSPFVWSRCLPVGRIACRQLGDDR